jgi:1,2-diacylglycerol 3-alpha-glucosyltransferase
MIIVFVIDTYGSLTNGTTITAYRFVEALKAKGHTVRIVGVGVHGPDMFPVRERYIPIVTPIARKQSTIFGFPDADVLRRAFQGADVVHFFMPWSLARKGRKIAQEMGIPCTAAFHVQPENITYGAGLGWFGKPMASFIYSYFRWTFYRYIEDIHCPSEFIARELKRHHYRARLHVISNGVGNDFVMAETPKTDDCFNILMVGRYAPEKRQDVLIKAIHQSKYEPKIRLYLAGAGPREAKLRRMAATLTNGATFGFYNQSDLIDLLHKADLYVHTADVEIEAISCLEAISCGKVPVISDSTKSATKQFALDDRSLFKAGSSRDLRDKIEYWIEHDEERKRMAGLYCERGKRYSLDYSIRKAEAMFQEAIHEKDSQKTEKTPEGHRYTRSINKGALLRLFSIFLYYGVAVPLLWLDCTFVLHMRIKDRKIVWKVVRKSGAVTISNHVHVLDSAMAGLAMFPKKPIYTSIPENFRLPLAGFFVNALGSVPIPRSLTEDRIFFHELSKHLRQGRFVHFFPEGKLVKNDMELRPFIRGAFELAVNAQVPVIPMRISIRRKQNRFPRIFHHRHIVLRIGEPVYPDSCLFRKEAVEKLCAQSLRSMEMLVYPPPSKAEHSAAAHPGGRGLSRIVFGR